MNWKEKIKEKVVEIIIAIIVIPILLYCGSYLKSIYQSGEPPLNKFNGLKNILKYEV